MNRLKLRVIIIKGKQLNLPQKFRRVVEKHKKISARCRSKISKVAYNGYEVG